MVANMFKRVLWDLSEDTEPILYIYMNANELLACPLMCLGQRFLFIKYQHDRMKIG